MSGPTVTGSGLYYQARPREQLLESAPGEHAWIVLASFRISAGNAERASRGERVNLDQENLATLSVGCYVCEQPYSRRVVHRRCPGEPKEGR